jgi:hypothetical protein
MGENYVMRSFIICTLYHINYYDDQIKEFEMGGVGRGVGDKTHTKL